MLRAARLVLVAADLADDAGLVCYTRHDLRGDCLVQKLPLILLALAIPPPVLLVLLQLVDVTLLVDVMLLYIEVIHIADTAGYGLLHCLLGSNHTSEIVGHLQAQ
jgi:hypothetical protein